MDQNTIDRELIDYLDNRYVLKDTCNDKHDKLEHEIAEMRVENSTTFAKVITKLSFIEKIDIIAATAIIGILVAKIGAVIFK